MAARLFAGLFAGYPLWSKGCLFHPSHKCHSYANASASNIYFLPRMYGRVVAARSREVSVTLSSVAHRADLSLTLSSLRLARLAPGAVTATAHGTSILATAAPSASSLVVDFRSRAAAIGCIPNTFPRRELAPAPYETLTSRLIDRSLRPVLARETPLALTARVLSSARPSAVSIDAIAVNAASASAAAAVVDTPHAFSPVGAARLALVDGRLVSFPSLADAERAEMCLFVAARDGKLLSLLIDGSSGPVSEASVLDIVREAVGVAGEVARAQSELVDKIREERSMHGRSAYPRVMPSPAGGHAAADMQPIEPHDAARVSAYAREEYERAFVECRKWPGKAHRADIVSQTQQKIVDAFPSMSMNAVLDIAGASARLAHRSVLMRDGVRMDGRRCSEVRPVRCATSVLGGAVHGSALFERGDTQVLACATIGLENSAQKTPDHIDTSDGLADSKAFFLHYSFPGYATGEEGKPSAGGSRREVGHGALAEASLRPVIGTSAAERLPYVTRVSSEVTASDGSSSMATVCAGSLALLDAGVPLREPVAGVAMGLVTGDCFLNADGEDDHVILSDILGAEDHFGSMDCKLSGTAEGLTAAQLDVKIASGLPLGVFEQVLDAGLSARATILNSMKDSMPAQRQGLPNHAPRSIFFAVSKPLAVKVLLQDRAAVLRAIENESLCRIHLEQDDSLSWGMRINAPSAEAAESATSLLKRALADFPVGAKLRARVIETRPAFAVLELENVSVTGVLHVSKINLLGSLPKNTPSQAGAGRRSYSEKENRENVPGACAPSEPLGKALNRATPDQTRYQDVRLLLKKGQWLDVLVVESNREKGVLRFGLASPDDVLSGRPIISDAFLEKLGGNYENTQAKQAKVGRKAGA